MMMLSLGFVKKLSRKWTMRLEQWRTCLAPSRLRINNDWEFLLHQNCLPLIFTWHHHFYLQLFDAIGPINDNGGVHDDCYIVGITWMMKCLVVHFILILNEMKMTFYVIWETVIWTYILHSWIMTCSINQY